MTTSTVHARNTFGTLHRQRRVVADVLLRALLDMASVRCVARVSWNKETLRSQVRFAPAAARNCAERNGKRVRRQRHQSPRRTPERSVARIVVP
jgi:hypothetical protein